MSQRTLCYLHVLPSLKDDAPVSWKSQCEEILKKVMNSPDSGPFINSDSPVNDLDLCSSNFESMVAIYLGVIGSF